MNSTAPRNFGEVFASLGNLWRQEGALIFIRVALNLGRQRSWTGTLWQLSLVALVLSLGFVFYMLYTEGHAAFNTSSDGVNWGSAISTYVFFALTSSGLSFIAAMPMVFGFRQFYPVAKRCVYLAIITLVAGFAVLALDLGHPFRMLWAMPTGLQIQSPMFWMGVFYLIDLALLVTEFYLLWQNEWTSRLSHVISTAAFISVVLASGMLGLVFGSMAMRPMWYGSGTSVFFIVSAALSGAAAIVMSTYLAYGFNPGNMPGHLREMATGDQLPKVFATLTGIVLVAILTRTWVGLWSNLDGLEGFHAMMRSPFFQLEVWVCLALPFVMMMLPALQREPRWQISAAGLVLLGMFIERYMFLVSGQNVPMFKGTWMESVTPYAPSLTEWMLVIVGHAILFALYALGERLFELSAEPGPAEWVAGQPAVQEGLAR
jgi:molybdopterin-containing oxidoreductase family membrane subunit